MNQSRRQILKRLAAAPLILPLGLTASPIMRYLRPTMKPLGLFDPADLPGYPAEELTFHASDFPEPWTCIPFMFPLKFVEFNPEQQEVREVPAFIIRTEKNEIVAYSRCCPWFGCILNYRRDPGNCGCNKQVPCCSCSVKASNPVLICPCDWSTFDLGDDGRVIRGPACRPPRRFELDRQDDRIAIVRLDSTSIG